jgi:hypothetical protein
VTFAVDVEEPEALVAVSV